MLSNNNSNNNSSSNNAINKVGRESVDTTAGTISKAAGDAVVARRGGFLDRMRQQRERDSSNIVRRSGSGASCRSSGTVGGPHRPVAGVVASAPVSSVGTAAAAAARRKSRSMSIFTLKNGSLLTQTTTATGAAATVQSPPTPLSLSQRAPSLSASSTTTGARKSTSTKELPKPGLRSMLYGISLKMEREEANFKKMQYKKHVQEEKAMQLAPTTPIDASKFVAYVQERRKKRILFKGEYLLVQRAVDCQKCTTSVAALMGERNQYPDTLPYDYNRVVLSSVRHQAATTVGSLPPGTSGAVVDEEQEPYRSYVNASYVQSWLCDRAYVVTQAVRTKRGSADFWRLVWELHTNCIVMLTKVFDFMRVMCLQYWPVNKFQFGEIEVETLETKSYAHFVIRTFQLKRVGGGDGSTGAEEEPRIVKHFHFTEWELNAFPYISAFIELRRRVRQWTDVNHVDAPILVHCSNGGGRSGAFLALDSNLELLKRTGQVDVFEYAKTLVNARQHLVDSVEQYTFIYDALCEALLCNIQPIAMHQLKERSSMYKSKKDRELMELQDSHESKLLLMLTPSLRIGDCAGGHRLENRGKNRDVMVVPPDHARPYLQTLHGESKDYTYINAVEVDGFTRKSEFIVTEWPKTQTLDSFWTLIFDHSVHTVINLTNQPPAGNSHLAKLYPSFIHSKGKRNYGPFMVEILNHQQYPGLTSYMVKITKRPLEAMQRQKRSTFASIFRRFGSSSSDDDNEDDGGGVNADEGQSKNASDDRRNGMAGGARLPNGGNARSVSHRKKKAKAAANRQKRHLQRRPTLRHFLAECAERNRRHSVGAAGGAPRLLAVGYGTANDETPRNSQSFRLEQRYWGRVRSASLQSSSSTNSATVVAESRPLSTPTSPNFIIAAGAKAALASRERELALEREFARVRQKSVRKARRARFREREKHLAERRKSMAAVGGLVGIAAAAAAARERRATVDMKNTEADTCSDDDEPISFPESLFRAHRRQKRQQRNRQRSRTTGSCATMLSASTTSALLRKQRSQSSPDLGILEEFEKPTEPVKQAGLPVPPTNTDGINGSGGGALSGGIGGGGGPSSGSSFTNVVDVKDRKDREHFNKLRASEEIQHLLNAKKPNVAAVRRDFTGQIDKLTFMISEIMASGASQQQLETEIRICCVIQVKTWPLENKVPFSTSSLIDLLRMTRSWRKNAPDRPETKPTIVMSHNGVSRCGIFIAANVCIDQMDMDHEVDVFHAVKMIRLNRPQLIDMKDEYKYLYDLMLHWYMNNPEYRVYEPVSVPNSPLNFDADGGTNAFDYYQTDEENGNADESSTLLGAILSRGSSRRSRRRSTGSGSMRRPNRSATPTTPVQKNSTALSASASIRRSGSAKRETVYLN